MRTTAVACLPVRGNASHVLQISLPPDGLVVLLDPEAGHLLLLVLHAPCKALICFHLLCLMPGGHMLLPQLPLLLCLHGVM